MITFKIFDPMVNHFNLFLDNRHSLSEVVVFPDLSGQLVNLRFHHTLSLVIGDEYTRQSDGTGDKGGNNSSLHPSHPQ